MRETYLRKTEAALVFDHKLRILSLVQCLKTRSSVHLAMSTGPRKAKILQAMGPTV